MFTLNKRRIIVLGALAAAAGTVSAGDLSVEGRISNIAPDPANPGAVKLQCNGVAITVPPSATVTTPTNSIGLADLLTTTIFPGRSVAGWDKGTCIIEGTNTGEDNVASSVYVEPAENVIVGEVSEPATTSTPMKLRGVTIVPLTKENTGGLMVMKPPKNEFGVEIKLETVPKGDLSAAEGYLSDDGKTLYAYSIETSGGDQAGDTTAPLATIQRADLVTRNAATFNYKVEVRGGCTFTGTATTQTVNLEILSGTRQSSTVPGTTEPNWIKMDVACTLDPAAPGNGLYRYKNDNFRATAVPTLIRAKVQSPPAPAGSPAPAPYPWSESIPLSIR
jgi:hypothetical protein